MPVFSPEFSTIFKTAAFVNLLSSKLGILVRLAVIIIFLSLMIVFAANNSAFARVWASLFMLSLMFEFFYKFKPLEAKPGLAISQLKDGTNIADSLSLDSAKVLLRAGNWSNVSDLVESLEKDLKVKSFFEKSGFNKDEVKALAKASGTELIDPQKLLAKAAGFSIAEKKEDIDQLDILLALFSDSKVMNQAAFAKELKEADLLNIAFWIRHLFEKKGRHFWERPASSYGLGIASLWEGGWTLETEKYSKNITEEIFARGVKNHLVGRKDLILQVEEILARSTKRNVILVGEPGVGKETVVYGLAEKSAHGLLPGPLKYKRFLEIDLTSLLASASSGVIEERLNNLLTELSYATDVVLYIPQIEYLTTVEGGGADITGLLLSTLKEGSLQIIGTTSIAAYRKNIESKGAFSETFEVVEMPEPDKQSSVRILEEAAANIEIRSGVVVSYKALETAVELSKQYMVDRVLPGKAIDLLDEAATAAALQKQNILQPSLIEQIVSQKTKTPVSLAQGKESEKLLNLEAELHKRIIDQEEAVKAISEAVRRARTLRREGSRPIGVFLFLGPTGVGKTETAKALADVYFGSEERIVREDMSEYQEEGSINRLIGAPPGSEGFGTGGQFTEKIRSSPYTTVLLDEIEKANPKIQEAFLPTFDEGKMTDSTGRQIIFTNTIIIATSNAGAEFIRESIQSGKAVTDVKKPLLEKLQREGAFKPEFLNRFDDIVLFKPLTQTEVNQIVQLMVSKFISRLSKQDIKISVDNKAIAFLATKGYDPTYGARPLNRIIQNELESSISKKILSGEVKRGSEILVSSENNNLTFSSLQK